METYPAGNKICAVVYLENGKATFFFFFFNVLIRGMGFALFCTVFILYRIHTVPYASVHYAHQIQHENPING